MVIASTLAIFQSVYATLSSSYRVGRVLSDCMNGVEQLILFVSRTISKSDRNYSQLEREALAIICV